MRIVSEQEFREVFTKRLDSAPSCDYVVGPGRSGAIAAVYASHYLGVPFVPFKCKLPGRRALVVDTAILTGATVRKASRIYGNCPIVYGFNQKETEERLKFWYEELSMVRGKGKEYV